jgi:hypothetical protein
MRYYADPAEPGGSVSLVRLNGLRRGRYRI